MSLRELSDKANIAHTYILKIENGSKPPPSDDVLLRLAKGLNLDDESAEIFFDLAAKCKRINDDKNFYIPADISEYLLNEQKANALLRKARKLGYSNEFWNELLKQIEKWKYVPIGIYFLNILLPIREHMNLIITHNLMLNI